MVLSKDNLVVYNPKTEIKLLGDSLLILLEHASEVKGYLQRVVPNK